MDLQGYKNKIFELNTQAIQYYQNGELEKAKECFEELYNRDVYNTDVNYNLAKVYYELHDDNRCVEILHKLLELGEQSDDVFELLGDAYFTLQKYSEALICYKRVSDVAVVQPKIEYIKKIFHETQDKVYLQYMNYPYPDTWTKNGIPKELLDSKKLNGEQRRKNSYLIQFADINFIQLKYWEKYKNLSNLRVFFAGCGTGEATVTSAFFYPEVQFTAIDISEQSINIAKGHAKELGINNITFMQKDIISITAKDFEPFDIIFSTGVLHHLYNPLQGIINLKNILKPDGILSGMVYSTTGRQEVYDFRNAFSNFFSEVEQMSYKLEATKAFLDILQPWQKLSRIKEMPDLCFGDQGIVDLLLNENETSYTSQELIDLFKDANMNLDFYDTDFLNPLCPLYNLNTKQGFVERIKLLDKDSQRKMAELINGSIFKWNFIAYKNDMSMKSKFMFNDDWLEYYPVLWNGVKLLKQNNEYSLDIKSVIKNHEISRYGYKNETYWDNPFYKLDKNTFEFLSKCDGQMKVEEIIESMDGDVDILSIKKVIYDLCKFEVLFMKENKFR